ncbi:MAG: NAD(P)H-dependent oxidoreductase subunit E [Eubacteriales bacterium]|nr:NAD(P)H-dependent oxidoreductase subunit E [Eubacteriales bacterium]
MKIKEILDKNGRTPDKLISSLLEYQKTTLCNYLTEDDLREFAKETGIPLSRISSVASFYSLLSTESRGRYIIQVCYDVPCYVNNSVNIVKELEKNLGIKMGQTTEDETFSLEFSSCLGCCDKAPVMQIGETLYGNLTSEKIASILDKYRGGKR